MNLAEVFQLDPEYKDFHATKEKIEAGLPLSLIEGDVFFSMRLHRLGSEHDATEWKATMDLMRQAQESGYDSESIREEYAHVFQKYGFTG